MYGRSPRARPCPDCWQQPDPHLEETREVPVRERVVSFEALSTVGYACSAGADLGEVLVTARGTSDGDEAAWHLRWKALAERLHAAYQGRSSDAREAWS
jgi:hypothetical protein